MKFRSRRIADNAFVCLRLIRAFCTALANSIIFPPPANFEDPRPGGRRAEQRAPTPSAFHTSFLLQLLLSLLPGLLFSSPFSNFSATTAVSSSSPSYSTPSPSSSSPLEGRRHQGGQRESGPTGAPLMLRGGRAVSGWMISI